MACSRVFLIFCKHRHKINDHEIFNIQICLCLMRILFQLLFLEDRDKSDEEYIYDRET